MLLATIKLEEQMIEKSELNKLKLMFGGDISVSPCLIKRNGSKEIKKSYYSYKIVDKFTEITGEMDEDDYKEERVISCDNIFIDDPNKYICDIEDLYDKFPFIKISVSNIRKYVDTSMSNMTSILEFMELKTNKIINAFERFDKNVEFNERCNVHIPNIGLLQINKLAYTTDTCTEQLQRHLNDGWKIIACCPQPDQRRPDYILGRYVEEDKDDIKCYEL